MTLVQRFCQCQSWKYNVSGFIIKLTHITKITIIFSVLISYSNYRYQYLIYEP